MCGVVDYVLVKVEWSACGFHTEFDAEWWKVDEQWDEDFLRVSGGIKQLSCVVWVCIEFFQWSTVQDCPLTDPLP